MRIAILGVVLITASAAGEADSMARKKSGPVEFQATA